MTPYNAPMHLRIPCVAALVLCVASSALAQGRGRREPNSTLAAVKGLTCTFPVSTGGEWTENQPAVAAPRNDAFTLRFFQVNSDDGTAIAVGFGDTVEVILRLVGDNMHLLDIRTNGALAITTVFSDRLPNGHFKAVHSRSQFADSIRPSPPDARQYYGECETPR